MYMLVRLALRVFNAFSQDQVRRQQAAVQAEMESAVRCGYLYFRFTSSGKTFPKKKFVQLCHGHDNGCPQLLVYEDERSSMAMSNCLCMILGQEAEEAKEWQGEAAWEYFSFKIVASDYEYVFSAASEKERDAWLEVICASLSRKKEENPDRNCTL
ncbi:uncharacterized protein LOC125038245 isoform X2 [Penaeus chinensis]|uniref:uncharacterized protein LOC125038245 isoform X2 n=1 Tax=Penaeus chinensis TaxID=139456 RepID=UPI001FB60281|nr:uncharacterized protein LOC125038245 isoform X2 [Penaeus chinensis]